MEFDTIDDGLTVKAEPRFANFGNRLVAAILDAIITIPLVIAAGYFIMFQPSWETYLAITILSALYKPVLEGLYGATLGKMIVKLKVVSKGGEKITWSQAFMRYLPWALVLVIGIWATKEMFQIPGLDDVGGVMEYFALVAEYQAEGGGSIASTLNSFAGLIPLVSVLIMLGNDRKQGAHDMLAETYVINTKPV